LLIFVNNEHIANPVTMGKVFACGCRGQNANADNAWAGIQSNLAKAIIRVYKNEINIGHFERLT